MVLPTLQTTRDPDIFAIGDCAWCPREGHPAPVPPRAQAAHQQASHLLRQIRRRLRNRPLEPFVYKDFGSLVSFGEYSAVGNLMGFLAGKSMMIEGFFARMMYRSLYKMHERALHGTAWTALELGRPRPDPAHRPAREAALRKRPARDGRPDMMRRRQMVAAALLPQPGSRKVVRGRALAQASPHWPQAVTLGDGLARRHLPRLRSRARPDPDARARHRGLDAGNRGAEREHTA